MVTAARATAQGQEIPGARVLRADAERNRLRILEAAHAVFAERGLNAPLEEIADRAGVGIATLYRRFPTREDLVAAAFTARLAEVAEAAEQACQHSDAWEGFCGFVEWVCATQAADRGLTDLMTTALPTADRVAALRARTAAAFAQLVLRAQGTGKLRSDFVAEDLSLLLLANAGVVVATKDAAPNVWRRLVRLMLEAFGSEDESPLPPPLTHEQTEQVMRHLGEMKRVCAPAAS
jgi:AcrR family transcriptional regulator